MTSKNIRNSVYLIWFTLYGRKHLQSIFDNYMVARKEFNHLRGEAKNGEIYEVEQKELITKEQYEEIVRETK